MTRVNQRKLNHFMVSAPSGVVLTSQWLAEQGISSKLAWWYVRSGLLERLDMKVYKKAKDRITWAGVVAALQDQIHLPLHVGGKTALQILGRSHFFPTQGLKQVVLFADCSIKLPSWLGKKKEWDAELKVFKTSLFDRKDKLLGIIEKPVNGLMLQISGPERAAIEMLYLYPKYQSFDEAILLMENLGQLRPAVIQQLLERCHSIKVKRLFLYLAEKCQHDWVSKLDFRKINLGSGKRVITPGGKYDSKYKVSLREITEK